MKLAITQCRSTINRPRKHKATVEALGLKRVHHTVVHDETPQIRGMIEQVSHLLHVEQVEEQ